MNLNDLALKYNNDKGSNWHDYMIEYEKYLFPLKDKELSILELGVGAGASLKIWYDYFRNAKIYGVDITPNCKNFENDRTKVFIGRQQAIKFLENVTNKIGEKLDIIIDDCGHVPDNQIISFKYLYTKLKQEGIYIIEDIRNNSLEMVVNSVKSLSKEMEILSIYLGKLRGEYSLIGRKL